MKGKVDIVAWAHKIEDIPSEEHYAIIEFGSIYIPGDERSRTNPGHGYPAETRTTIEYIMFEDEETWEEEIRKRLDRNEKNWKAVVVKPAKIETHHEIKIT